MQIKMDIEMFIFHVPFVESSRIIRTEWNTFLCFLLGIAHEVQQWAHQMEERLVALIVRNQRIPNALPNMVNKYDTAGGLRLIWGKISNGLD